MSIYKKMFEQVAADKFGKNNFTYREWYEPNRDVVNYTITNSNNTKQISIDGLTLLNVRGSVQLVMRQMLDEEFKGD